MLPGRSCAPRRLATLVFPCLALGGPLACAPASTSQTRCGSTSKTATTRFNAQVLRLTQATAFDKHFPPDHSWHPRLFVPTGAYILEQYRSGALASPQEEDVKAMQSFIECANRLLPDDAARERAGLKLEDLQYEVQSSWELSLPVYRKAEKEVGNVYRRV